MCVAVLVSEMNSKLSLEGFKIIKNESLGSFGGVLGALGFMNAKRRADKDESEAISAPLGRFSVPFWRPVDFEEASRDNFPTKST